MKSLRNWAATRRFRRCRRGAITIEFAFAAGVLSMMLVGVVDYGIAFTEQMRVTNAVRAGSQFALVRHPSLGPEANEHDAVVSLQDIRDAVVASADFLESDPGEALGVCVYYVCPDGTATPCVAGPGPEPGCEEWQTLVEITLSRDYELILPYPGFGPNLTLSAAHTVRLN